MPNHSVNHNKKPDKKPLPHQFHDIRPEEIVKIEEEAPQKRIIITETLKITEYSRNRTVASGQETFVRQRSFEEIIRVGLSPALEDNIRQTHKKEKRIIKKLN